MKEGTQRDRNPFPYSDTNKRYHTYEYYLRHTFGGRVAKISLDAGFTCPNIDGRCGTGGCIYCSARGSGDFAPDARLPLALQYEMGRALVAGKWQPVGYIPYFQAHTNTYAPVEKLRELFFEALALPQAVGLSIATRADCLPDAVIDLLAELSHTTHLTVELGLQSSSDKTALRINRGHGFALFLDTWQRLRARAPLVRLSVHLMLGLPGESMEEMLASVRAVAALAPDEVKLHALYVTADAPLAADYLAGRYQPITEECYVDTVVRALELLPQATVVSRLTGDAPKKTLLAPAFTARKREVMAEIDKALAARDTWQGRLASK